MGIKSNYFRHSFDAHNDSKIRKLIQKCGAKGYAVYFVLLEVYCSKLRDDDSSQIEQEIDLKLIASYLGVRSDSVHSCIIVMGELKLIEALSLKYDQTMIKLSVPKSLKYYGKYKSVWEENCPNKRKENKIKEKEIKNKEKGEHFLNIGVEETGTRNPRNSHGMQSLSDAIISDEISEILANLKQDDNYNVEQ